MSYEKEMPAPVLSVGADKGQTNISNNDIITDGKRRFNNGFRKDFPLPPAVSLFEDNYFPTISMDELYERVYVSGPAIIDGLLYPGTYILAGAPKIGKSFLVAQIAYHVSKGLPLWGYDVRQGSVLYMALEDDHSRLQKRLYQMFGAEVSEDLQFSVSAGLVDGNLEDQIKWFMYKNQRTNLVIIDTLQKVRDSSGESYSYQKDYEVISRLKRVADTYKIALILVHHTRKQQADDSFDMISGTNGLMGAADGALIMSKNKRTDNEAVIDVVGRDQQDQRLYIRRNPEHLIWELDHAETELWKAPPEPVVDAVAGFFSQKVSEWTGTATELLEQLGLDMKANELTRRLNINAARLLNEHGICYGTSRDHDGRHVWLKKNMPEA